MTNKFVLLTGSFVILLNLNIHHLKSAETSRFIYLQQPQTAFTSYLINSGRMTPQFVLNQPFEMRFSGQSSEKTEAIQYFKEYWRHFYPDSGARVQLRLADMLKYQNRKIVNRYLAEGGLHLIFPHITLGNRTTVNEEYKRDPLYAGDLSEAANWLYGRVNEAYMNLRFGGFSFFIGRMKRNWGPVDSYSLMLSDHPYTYDHVLFSYQTDFLKLSVIMARLEDLSAIALEDPDQPDSLTFYPSARKFLAGHRLDLRFSDNFQIALTEMTTFGGPDRDFDLSFINPMTFFYALQRNDRKVNDGNWTVDIFYKPISRFTFYGQFLIDDIIVNNDPGVNDRERYPDRLAIKVSMQTSDMFLNGLNTSLTYVRVWNRTYQSRWTWENYHYRGLGLGYPRPGSEEIKLKLDLWEFFPFFFRNELIYGRYGDVSLTDVYPAQKAKFPRRPVRYNLVDRLTVYYFLNPSAQFYFSMESYRDAHHYLNRLNEGSDFTVSVGIECQLSSGLGFVR